MFFPFEALLEKEIIPPEEGLDVEPIVLQFEVYVRVVLGIAYDRCRQLWEEAETDQERDLLNRALQIHESVERTVSQQVYGTCVSKYSSGLESWFAENNLNSEIIELLPETGQKDIKVNSILKNQKKTITLGEYRWNILLMIDTIQRVCPEDKVLGFLERAVIPVTIYIELRNKNGHNFTLGHKRTLEKLRKWLQEQQDPLFTNDLKYSCELIIPYKCNMENSTVQCAVRRGKDLDRGNIQFEFLHREKLFAESLDNLNQYPNEFKKTVFLRMPFREKGKKQYFRISPFINVKEGDVIFADAEYGMLLKNTPGGEFQYRNMQITNGREEKDAVTGEDYSENEIIDFEKKYCFYVSSCQEIKSSKMKVIGETTHLFISRHSEFRSVVNTNRPFSYYPVINETENNWIGQLQKKGSGVHLVFLTGHGGLGKTHLVINLLRTRYDASYSPKGDDIRFDQVMFLSAKKTSIEVTSGLEIDLDHDIGNYENMIDLMSEHLLARGAKQSCQDDLAGLEEKLIKNSKKQFIIIDDLDTMKLDDQKKVCRFFERFKGENHRVLITSRLVPLAVSSLVSQQTSIMLRTLDCRRSLEFCKKYIKDNALEKKEISASEIAKIHPFTCGVPLNLVMFLHLKEHGCGPDQLYSEEGVGIDQSTEFIFRHVLEALDTEARYTFGMLSRYGKAINAEGDVRVIGYNTLRLLVPFLSDEDYEGAVETLNTYSIIDKSDDKTIFLRRAVFLNNLNEIVLHEESQSILEYVEKDPKKWSGAMSEMRLFLNNMLEIAKDWKNSGDMKKRTWAAGCARIVLENTIYEEEIESGHTRNEWENLQMCSVLNNMEKLKEQVENLQKLDAEKEESINLLVDRYYKVLDTLNKCHKKWPEYKEQITQAFNVCANMMLGIYNNTSGEVDQVISEVENRLAECYRDFEKSAKECVSEKCEQVLNMINCI